MREVVDITGGNWGGVGTRIRVPARKWIMISWRCQGLRKSKEDIFGLEITIYKELPKAHIDGSKHKRAFPLLASGREIGGLYVRVILDDRREFSRENRAALPTSLLGKMKRKNIKIEYFYSKFMWISEGFP
jgi:hypothetical protein